MSKGSRYVETNKRVKTKTFNPFQKQTLAILCVVTGVHLLSLRLVEQAGAATGEVSLFMSLLVRYGGEVFTRFRTLPKLCGCNQADQGTDARCEQTWPHHAKQRTPFLPLVFIA